jgi:two-component system, OmpR family, sensor histidine kinase ChvG
VDFSPPDSTIVFRLADAGASQPLTVEVQNAGPPLPPEAPGRIFESLWQARDAERGEKPHFGLGLYIVRLIARHHGGEATADNLPDGSGVVFRIRLRREAAVSAPMSHS